MENPLDDRFAEWVEGKRRYLLMVAVLAAAFWTALYLQFSVDDAYISFRYGRVLVTNHTWNWNPTGTREEAYTCAIYTALSIVPALFRISPALFFKIVGLICLALIYLRLRTQSRSPFAYLLGVLVLGLHPWVWLHSYSGLETPLYILAILELALCVENASSISPKWVYGLALLLPLIRPEGILFAIAAVLLYRVRRGSLPKQTGWLFATTSLGLAYFVVRWRYFHQLLPNPFYVKVSQESLRGTVEHIANSLAQYRGYVLALVLILLLARKAATRVFSGTALLLLFALFFPHDMPMNYADRYIFQICLPVVLLFIVVEDVRQVARIAAVVVCTFMIATNFSDLVYGVRYFPAMLRAHVDLGRRLAPYAAGHTMIAGDVGVIPYYSNWETYDFVGLATGRIAMHGLDDTSLRKMRPDLIILYNAKPGPELLNDRSWVGPEPAASTIVQYIRESGEYSYAASARANNFYLVEFLRKDTPQFNQILNTLKQNGYASEQEHLSVRRLLEQHYVPWRDN